MKKWILVAIAGVGGVLAKRQMDSKGREQDLWREATDPVQRD